LLASIRPTGILPEIRKSSTRRGIDAAAHLLKLHCETLVVAVVSSVSMGNIPLWNQDNCRWIS
jgi:hypothetical protein